MLFTIPLRRALILKASLRFPEGVATAEVLKVGSALPYQEGGRETSHTKSTGDFRTLLSAALLVLGAKRIGPDRSERIPTAVEPPAELHPLVEVPSVLLAELFGQLVHATRVTTEAFRGLGADLVEAGWARARRRIVRHRSP